MTTVLRNRTLFVFVTLLGALLLLVQAQDKGGKAKGRPGPPGANHPERTQVLIITGQNPHDWRGTTASLRKTLEDTEKFETREIDEFRSGTPEMLEPYALIILNYYDGRKENRFGERADNAIAEFVRSGKGLVLYHLSLVAFDGWTDYEKM